MNFDEVVAPLEESESDKNARIEAASRSTWVTCWRHVIPTVTQVAVGILDGIHALSDLLVATLHRGGNPQTRTETPPCVECHDAC